MFGLQMKESFQAPVDCPRVGGSLKALCHSKGIMSQGIREDVRIARSRERVSRIEHEVTVDCWAKGLCALNRHCCGQLPNGTGYKYRLETTIEYIEGMGASRADGWHVRAAQHL